MTDEQALALLYRYLQLNHVQEIVFRASWQGQSYAECAEAHGYVPGYLKFVGYKLWRLLSSNFNKTVTKSNLKSILNQHFLISMSNVEEQCKPDEMDKVDPKYTADIRAVSERIAVLTELDLDPVICSILETLSRQTCFTQIQLNSLAWAEQQYGIST